MRLLKTHPLLGLSNSFRVDSPQPSTLSYMWNGGSLLGLVLVLQIVTGVSLAIHYVPEINLAFASVEHISRDVYYGWARRYAHANGASLFFLVVYLHVLRGLYYGSYSAPRTLAWIIGVVILVLIMGTAFRGYTTPFGQMSLWGATVITNLLSVVPYRGYDLVTTVWGGFSVSAATLNRFFALHFLLPFVLAALAAMHMLAIHEHGSSNPSGSTGNIDRMPFAPYFVFKDLVTVLALLLRLSLLVAYAPNILGHSDNYIMANPIQTPASIVPEWYLLPYYAILRSVPIKSLGVVAMLASLLVLIALPLLDQGTRRGATHRPRHSLVVWLLVFSFIALMVLGGLHVEAPFVGLGQGYTFLYFAWFVVLVPFLAITENSVRTFVRHRAPQLQAIVTIPFVWRGTWTLLPNLHISISPKTSLLAALVPVEAATVEYLQAEEDANLALAESEAQAEALALTKAQAKLQGSPTPVESPKSVETPVADSTEAKIEPKIETPVEAPAKRTRNKSTGAASKAETPVAVKPETPVAAKAEAVASEPKAEVPVEAPAKRTRKPKTTPAEAKAESVASKPKRTRKSS